MSWRGMRDLDEWRSRLGVEGRVEINPRRWVDLLAGVFLVPIGVAMVVGALLAEVHAAVALFIGACGALAALASLANLVRALRPGPVLVVHRDGLTFPRLQVDVTWSEVLLVGVFHSRNYSWLQVHLVPSAIEALRERTSAGWWARRQVRADHIYVGGTLDADKDHLVAWLNEEARSRRLL